MGAGLLHFAGLAQVARDTALEASVPFRFDPGQLHPRATSSHQALCSPERGLAANGAALCQLAP